MSGLVPMMFMTRVRLLAAPWTKTILRVKLSKKLKKAGYVSRKNG